MHYTQELSVGQIVNFSRRDGKKFTLLICEVEDRVNGTVTAFTSWGTDFLVFRDELSYPTEEEKLTFLNALKSGLQQNQPAIP